jgi:hypothetical protein
MARAMSVNRQSVVPVSRISWRAVALISSMVAVRARSRRGTSLYAAVIGLLRTEC